jgi:hypothetical protein
MPSLPDVMAEAASALLPEQVVMLSGAGDSWDGPASRLPLPRAAGAVHQRRRPCRRHGSPPAPTGGTGLYYQRSRQRAADSPVRLVAPVPTAVPLRGTPDTVPHPQSIVFCVCFERSGGQIV